MRVFISWSGDGSREVAEALCDLLPDAKQGLTTWMSYRDIAAGQRWGGEVDRELKECSFGILCLTSRNLNEPWVLFEAGALRRSVSQRVVPYLFGLSPNNVPSPLDQFQCVEANQTGTAKLLQSLNQADENRRLEDSVLMRQFDRWWPDLRNRLSRIPVPSLDPPPIRQFGDMGHQNRGQIGDEWERILTQEAKGVSDTIYISPGDLSVMGPMLYRCRRSLAYIKRICVKRMMPDLFTYLSQVGKPFLPLIESNVVQKVDIELNVLCNAYSGAAQVDILDWPTMPPFHGVLYHDYLSFHQWSFDSRGKMSNDGQGWLLRRTGNELLFDDYAEQLRSGF